MIPGFGIDTDKVNMRHLLITFLVLSFVAASAQSQRAIDSLLKILPGTSDTNRVNLLNQLAWEMRFSNQSLKYCDEARALSEKLGFQKGYAASITNKGNTYFNISRPAESLKCHTAALHEWQKLGDKKSIARSNSNIGLAYAALSNYTEALKYQLLALKMREEIKDKDGLSMSYFNLTAVYLQLGKYKEALSVAEKGMALDKERGDKAGVAGWHSNMGIIHRNLGDYKASLRQHEESVKLRIEIDDEYGLCGSYMNIGNTYENLGDLAKALEFHQKSYDLAKKLGDNDRVLGGIINLGRVYSMLNEHEKGLKHLHMALDSARANDMLYYESIICTDLAEAYARKKDFAKAYEYHLLYAQTKDSLLSEDNSRQIAEMQTLYETEKKEKENEILRQKNEIQELESAKKDEALGKQLLIIYSVTGGFLLSALLAFFVYRGYREKKSANVLISAQKREVERQKEIVEEKNKSITDSINYAKKIQRAILPSGRLMQRLLPEHFILYIPKDIVSGDFYWAVSPQPGVCVVAIADCTGHGVPGAFMSMIGISLLNEIVTEKKITRPDLVLNNLRESIIKALSSEEEEAGRDGMDIVLCRFDMNEQTLEFAAANNPLWVFSQEGFMEFKGDKFPVGPHPDEHKPFTLHEVKLQKGTCIYTFSDGYADQFGGPDGKKFKYRQLQEIITSVKGKPMSEQHDILQHAFAKWRGGLEQVDDVLVMGMRV